MRVVVTGGAGFIGSHLVEALQRSGHDVLVIDNLSSGRRERLPRDVDFAQVDIRNTDRVDSVFKSFRPDVVHHLAAQAEVPRSVEDPIEDATINLIGSLNLLEASRRQNVRQFIFASTGGAVYGDPPTIPCDESTVPRPLSPYGAAKLAVEGYVGTYSRTFHLPGTVLRYANVYGPRQDGASDEGRVIAIFARLILRGQRVTIDGDGSQGRDMIHVSDVVSANLAAMERPQSALLNIGSGRLTTVMEVFEMLIALTGAEQTPAFGPKRPGDVYRIALDTSAAKSALGWAPTINLEDGLRNTIEYFRRVGKQRLS